jgi:hypothetical protein
MLALRVPCSERLVADRTPPRRRFGNARSVFAALAAALDDMLARKPRLASRRPTGENRTRSLTSGGE